MDGRDPYFNLEYPEDVIAYMATKVTGSVFEVFRVIWNNRDEGILKGRLGEEFSRRNYDNAVLVLEAMGFITIEQKGRGELLFPTTRGLQLKRYIQNRPMNKEEKETNE